MTRKLSPRCGQRNPEARLNSLLPKLALAAALVSVSVTVAAEDSLRFRQEAPLASFLAPEKSLILRNTRAGADVFFPVSDRIETIQASLHLEFTNSISLVQNRSQLRVSLNGNVLAQFRLNPDRPTVVADIELPERLLERGYNRLTFGASQHYTERCEDPSAPELWTRIDPVASTIRLEGSLAPVEPKLSGLSNLMDRKLWGPFELSLVTGTTELGDEHLRWGSLISQGAALRLDYVPLNVRWLPAEQHISDPTTKRRQGRRFPRMAQEALVGRDAVLFGTRTELAPFLTREHASRIVGAYLSIAPLDEDPAHFLLVVSGTNDAEVDLAATAFAFPDIAFPEAPESIISDIELPSLAETARSTLSESGTYLFSQLGFETTTFQGKSPAPAEIELSIPPDLFSAGDDQLELSLHLAFGAALRDDSVVNITLNGEFERAIFLNDPNGGIFWDYPLSIPVRSLKAGPNVLRFEPHMRPLVAAECEGIQDGNLVMTLFDDSSLFMPDTAHFVAMPDLSLLARTGFPYTVESGGEDLALQIMNREGGAVEAAWMLLAKLAQIARVPSLHARLGFESMDGHGHGNLIVVGTEDRLDAELLAGGPIEFGETSRTSHGIFEVHRPIDSSASWLARLWARRKGRLEPHEPLTRTHVARIRQSGGLGRNHAVLQFQSPTGNGDTVTIFTAASPEGLSQGMRRLVEPALWANLAGDVVVWRDDVDSMRSQRVGPTYYLGEGNPVAWTSFLFASNPLYWLVTLLTAIGVLSLATRYLLRQYRRKHHPYIPESA